MTEVYRQGIVAVLINDLGQVLLAERSDLPDHWQFPQGGIEGDKTPTEAFFREVREELGNGQCEILKVSSGQTTYRWPEPGRKYVGQQQTWFLARFMPRQHPQLENSDGCFRACKWEPIENVLAQTIAWKKSAYQKGLTMLGLLKETL